MLLRLASLSFFIMEHRGLRSRLRYVLSCVLEYQAAAFKMASSSSFQILHCSGLTVENSHPPGVLRPHPGRRRLATPTRPPPVFWSGLWRSYEWHDLPDLCSRQSRRAWRPGKTSLEKEVGRGCCTLPTSFFPWSRRTTARPIGSVIWRVAASLWVYAALFCLVTDTLEMKFMT